ncbi:uncharacterized protein LOC120320443 isoform X3 [Drosophila yakuba]|uniref:uncharacterized protein LOC120320443 isoform X3 n=1 Tax=Drosophila yakuba TaxID=7245 RepID=UPI0019308AA6|nr:uncharacterized protein LOC120320443 isoform X3 [Drosophila yakuba]
MHVRMGVLHTFTKDNLDQEADGKQDERSRRQDMSRSRTQKHMCVDSDSVTVAGNCHFSVVVLL